MVLALSGVEEVNMVFGIRSAKTMVVVVMSCLEAIPVGVGWSSRSRSCSICWDHGRSGPALSLVVFGLVCINQTQQLTKRGSEGKPIRVLTHSI